MKAVIPVLCLLGAQVFAQTGAKNGEWPTYGADLGNTHYSALDQIDASNFNKLTVAWRFKTDSLGPRPEYQFETTPLMVRGVVYTTAGTRRDVVALDAANGEMLWMHRENEGARGSNAPRQLSGRGLAYWTDGREERILYVTPGYRLIALDAKTGSPVSSFGEKGVVDLKLDDDQEIDLVTGEVGLHATPVVAKDTVIVGAAHRSGGVPKSFRNVKGFVRGYDVRTGKRLWIFHTIPRPGEFGIDTWLNDSWSYTGNTGVWGQISVDEDLGLVYLPVELPTGDYYGAHRPGNNLFGESLVAVDLKTGQRKWHYQLVHHGLWDMDIPCAPILADITVNGRTIKAVAQPTKQANLYVFDRTNGQPIWPIEERPVAKGDVPGEWYSPTQPFPTKPPAYDRQGVSLSDLIDFTPALHDEAVKLVSKYKIGPMFTAPVVSKAEGPLATLILPSATGGTNWPGGSYDPETHMTYAYSQTNMGALGLVPSPDSGFSEMEFVQGTATAGARRTGGAGAEAGAEAPAGPAAAEASGASLTVQGLPLVKPPYGRITAIDLNKGEIAWQIAHGETPDIIRNHPALKGLNIPRTGRSGIIGTLLTKTLVIAGEAGTFTMPDGRKGAMLRAYNKATGQEVGAVYLPAQQSGTPMTYMLNGKQYVIVAVGGNGYAGELIAFRLPG
ncbi:MAG: pyrroloquinoline quinone-dependent dehydrogenase [Bryobacterales bacterium]|nr:pyrroloquinoline quinone-dependent dehydrogenase [Bryobacterales bacterium]MBV9400881.1 pyrroloquinoline quinone-dependent dehydrogenase [Bryobacterales bacterium]